LINKIRELPGFDRFLRAHSEDEIRDATESGPIVIVNVSDYRCDALIVERTSIRCIPLLSMRKADLRQKLAQKSLEEEVLGWLWRTVAEPVLSALGWTQVPSNGHWPHIWWIPTGLLARFPIHAAGDYSEVSTNTVLDRAISSYSTSVKAIIYGRTQRHQASSTMSSGEIVLVAMQKTPELGDLNFVSVEVNNLESLFKPTQLQVRKPAPLRQDVLSALNNCRIFHFAGHGKPIRLILWKVLYSWTIINPSR
jgi:CHAT domain